MYHVCVFSLYSFTLTSISLRDLPLLKDIIIMVALCKFVAGKACFVSDAIFPLIFV